MSTDLSSGLLNTKHQGQGREDNLDYTIDARREEAGGCARETNALEDLSRQD